MPSTLSADTKPSLAAASQRDVGLTRAIGPWALAASIVNVVVGAGIFAVPAALAANVGPYAPLAFLVCAGVITSVAICFAEGGSRLPTSGGAYGYVNAAFGPFTGYVAGTTLWFSNTLACGGIAAALADLAGSLFPPPMRSFVHVAAILGVVGGMALVNLGGVSRGTRLVTAATVLKLIPLGVFVIAGAGAIQRANFTPVGRPDGENLGRALILALFTFTGMETPLSASGEVAQPARTIPRALVISIAFVTALYVAIQVIAQGILGPSLAHSDAPLADAMARLSPALRLLMLAGAAVSMFGWIGSDMLGTPRVLFAFARDGLLPRPLGRIHATTSAPHVAILSYATLVIVLALTGTFAELAVLSTLCIAVLYSAACAAAFWLARARVALAGPPLNFRWLGVAAGMAISSMVVLVAMASRAEIFGLLAVLCLSAAVYLLQTRLGRRPA
jgi:basic amino acid/polyamine antiporter, APA family